MILKNIYFQKYQSVVTIEFLQRYKETLSILLIFRTKKNVLQNCLKNITSTQPNKKLQTI